MKSRDIQLEILTRLLSALSLRYSEARPADVANDLYNYHLQFLVKKGLVKKDRSKYSLTPRGIKHVADIRPLNPVGQEPDRFKVNVWTIVFKKEKGKLYVLNQLRRRHPFYGEIGIMGGSIKKGELVIPAALRKLKEETGLEATFMLVGMVRKIVLEKNGELFSDTLFHVCIAKNHKGELKVKTPFGDNFWTSVDDGIKNEQHRSDATKAIISVLRSIKKHSTKTIPFFYKEEIHVV